MQIKASTSPFVIKPKHSHILINFIFEFSDKKKLPVIKLIVFCASMILDFGFIFLLGL